MSDSDLTCECETNPAMIEGPAEHCLVHGNPRLFAELLEQAEVQLAEAVDALRDISVKCSWGWSRVIGQAPLSSRLDDYRAIRDLADQVVARYDKEVSDE